MSFFYHSVIGALVPELIKKALAALKRIFRLRAIDDATKARVAVKEYPRYYKIGYTLWLFCLFSIGFVAFGYIAFYLPATSVDFDFRNYWKFIFFGGCLRTALKIMCDIEILKRVWMLIYRYR